MPNTMSLDSMQAVSESRKTTIKDNGNKTGNLTLQTIYL